MCALAVTDTPQDNSPGSDWLFLFLHGGFSKKGFAGIKNKFNTNRKQIMAMCTNIEIITAIRLMENSGQQKYSDPTTHSSLLCYA